VIFVEAPQSDDEVAAVARAFPDVPLLFNWAEGGKTPPIELNRLTELGFRLVICPISTLLAATKAVREVLHQIKVDGSPTHAVGELPPFGEFLDFIGLPEVRQLEQEFSDGAR